MRIFWTDFFFGTLAKVDRSVRKWIVVFGLLPKSGPRTGLSPKQQLQHETPQDGKQAFNTGSCVSSHMSTEITAHRALKARRVLVAGQGGAGCQESGLLKLRAVLAGVTLLRSCSVRPPGLGFRG
jgi:hypothetical protein